MRLLVDQMERSKNCGWITTSIVFLVYFLNMSVPIYGAAIINTSMALELGLDVAMLGYAASICSAVRALTAFFGGRLIARFGARKTMALGSIVAATMSGLLSFAPLSLYVRILVFGFCGVGIVLGATLSSPVLIRQQFGTSSSLPMAIALSAGSISGMVAPLAINRIVGAWGWRSGWLAGLLCAASAFLLSVFGLHDVQTLVATERYEKNVRQHYKRGKTYVILTSSYGIRTMAFLVIVNFAVVMFHEAGYRTVDGTAALSILSAAGLAGRLLQGLAAKTRLKLKFQSAFACFGISAGCLLMMSGRLGVMLSACGLFGFCYGAGYILMPLLNAEYYTSWDYGQFTGETITWGAIFSAAGPAFSAALLHTSLGFVVVFFILFGLGILSGVSNLLLR